MVGTAAGTVTAPAPASSRPQSVAVSASALRCARIVATSGLGAISRVANAVRISSSSSAGTPFAVGRSSMACASRSLATIWQIVTAVQAIMSSASLGSIALKEARTRTQKSVEPDLTKRTSCPSA